MNVAESWEALKSGKKLIWENGLGYLYLDENGKIKRRYQNEDYNGSTVLSSVEYFILKEETMTNAKEIIQALLQGQKIHHKNWHPRGFIYLDSAGKVVDEMGISYQDSWPNLFVKPEDWSIFKQLTLDDLKPGQFARITAGPGNIGKVALCFKNDAAHGVPTTWVLIPETNWIGYNSATLQKYECEIVVPNFVRA